MCQNPLQLTFLSYLAKSRKSRSYYPLQTDQSKESLGNYIVSLKTSDELAEIIESKRMNFFELPQQMSLAWLEDFFRFENDNNISFEWSNGEAYQPILGNGGSCSCFFRIRINLPSPQRFSEGWFIPRK